MRNLPAQLQIPLEYDLGGVAIHRASEMTIQANEHETVISFFATDPPLLIGTAEQQEAAAKKLKRVKATCVCRVAIPTSKLQQFQQAQQEQRHEMNGFKMLPRAKSRR